MPTLARNLQSFSVRASLMASLLVAEILPLQLSLDGDWFSQDGSSSTWVFRNAFWGVNFVVAFVIAFLILAGSRLGRIRETLETDPGGYRWRWFFVVHLVAYSWFAWLSLFLFREGAATPFRSIIWLLSACCVGFSWALSCAPWEKWHRLFREETGTITIAGLTALIACALGAATGSLWDRLAPYTLLASYALLVWVFNEVRYDLDERILGAADFAVEIAPECSGYEGIGIVTVFLAVYIWVFRSHLRLPNAYLLPLIGIVASWCGNALRIAALIAIGATVSPDLALGGFHSQAGWIVVCTVGLALVAISRRVTFFASFAEDGHSAPIASHADALLLPFLAGIASGMLTEAAGLEPSRAYVVRSGLLLMILLWYRAIYLELPRRRTWHSAGLGLAAFLLWSFLVTPPVGESTSTLVSAVDIDFVWFPWRFVWYVALIPIVEELAFRKYLIDRLRSLSFGWAEPHKNWIAVGVSGICFGLLHGTHWMPGIAAGVLFGIAFLRQESVLDAVIAHAVCNGSIAVYAILTGSWWLWG